MHPQLAAKLLGCALPPSSVEESEPLGAHESSAVQARAGHAAPQQCRIRLVGLSDDGRFPLYRCETHGVDGASNDFIGLGVLPFMRCLAGLGESHAH